MHLQNFKLSSPTEIDQKAGAGIFLRCRSCFFTLYLVILFLSDLLIRTLLFSPPHDLPEYLLSRFCLCKRSRKRMDISASAKIVQAEYDLVFIRILIILLGSNAIPVSLSQSLPVRSSEASHRYPYPDTSDHFLPSRQPSPYARYL